MESNVTPKELIPLIEALYRLMNDNQFSLLNETLLMVDVTTLAPEFIVTYVRVTYPCRELLSKWKLLVMKSHSVLSMRGYDADSIFTRPVDVTLY